MQSDYFGVGEKNRTDEGNRRTTALADLARDGKQCLEFIKNIRTVDQAPSGLCFKVDSVRFG